ncbi:TPA: ABC transporter ATP-binding protein [Photobacterium damselae]
MSYDTKVIEVNNIGKCYLIYKKPIHRLFQMVTRNKIKKKLYDEFWALRNITFDVCKGETVGIIGTNGSGKSTLLQIICGTLNKNEGDISVTGRVAALLELGAGFNPEYTGRENVYLACSIYGLTKEDVDNRFDSIANFADIGEHIEQPVKTYSSGMYVRLAFAVIAHVDADILIIDEALAVGDAVFTQKCMRFIRKFREKGTLLFVSHDTNAVINLCEKVVWIDNGKLKAIGPAKEISEKYLEYTLNKSYGNEAELTGIEQQEQQEQQEHSVESVINYNSQYNIVNNLSDANGWKTGKGEITGIKIKNLSTGKDFYIGGERIQLDITAKSFIKMEEPAIGFSVKDRLGQELFGENTLYFTEINPVTIDANGEIKATFIFKLPMLPNGKYSMMVSFAEGVLHDHIQHHWMHDAYILNVSSSVVRWGLVGLEFEEASLELKRD